MKFKKVFFILVLLIVSILTLTACNKEKDKLSIVCTIFPEYDWVNEIIGDENKDIELTLLLDNGVDLHSYQPSVEDITKISMCDLFIYVGGESDAWVEDALENIINEKMVVINLLNVLGNKIKEEEIIEGMDPETEHDHDDVHEQEIEYDEHVWLSLKNAKIICQHITNELKKIDEKKATKYDENLTNYISKLTDLDAQYSEIVTNSIHKTLLFGDRFPFRYLVDDYKLSYYAAFVGCSAETEASFETIIFLAQKVDELSLPAICTIEGDNHNIANTIKNNTALKTQLILTFNSMQSTILKDIDNGVTYLSIMEENLTVLKQALESQEKQYD